MNLSSLQDVLRRRTATAALTSTLFSGMNSALYVLVAIPFTQELLRVRVHSDPRISYYSAWIQAAFLIGWAVGGAWFGMISDRFGRARAFWIAILAYALFTALCAVAQMWWHALILRFLAAMGIGGQGAAGSTLVAETWPAKTRPWLSAMLQAAGIAGNLLAAVLLGILPDQPRLLFLVGLAPIPLAIWVACTLPESAQWVAARGHTPNRIGLRQLFDRTVLRTTLITSAVCLVAQVTFQSSLLWLPQYLRSLADLSTWSASDKNRYVSHALTLATLAAIAGSFFSSWLAQQFGYRRATMLMFFGGLVTMLGTYGIPRDHISLLVWLPCTQFFVQGIFGIFLLYLPAVFPVLLRSLGSGFSLNIGRVAAALAVVLAGMGAFRADYRSILLYVSLLYVPAMLLAAFLPEPIQEAGSPLRESNPAPERSPE